MIVKESIDLGEREFIIESGRIARQADGSVLVQYGDTAVLVTAVSAKEPRANVSFLPLSVDYIEQTFAAGRIPGGYFKREGRPTEKETLTCRLIDRPIRPLFPKGYNYESQIIAFVLSSDQENDSDILAITGASTALMISDIAWAGPIAALRVGKINGQLVLNPTISQRENSTMDLVVVCSDDSIVMVEGGVKEETEESVLDALYFALDQSKPLLDLQRMFVKEIGKTKRTFEGPKVDDQVLKRVMEIAHEPLRQAIRTPEKLKRHTEMDKVRKACLEALAPEFEDRKADLDRAFDYLERTIVRGIILHEGVRIDGRAFHEVRPIRCEVGVLGRTHGSSLFTRGETQALVVTTMGTRGDEQKIEDLTGGRYKSFMLHYNFPPFSVGEVKPMRGPGRREIGHGALAERAIVTTLPSDEEFPYTVRIVSDILESNGSSSMATVCGSSLALMDAGVPTKAAVAGVAMGMVVEGDKTVVLTDIMGDEDHLGDMDFKVAGTRKGLTAMQMDCKVSGVAKKTMGEALYQARDARMSILDVMDKTIKAPREELSPHAPRIVTLYIKPERIREIIGPQGRTIKGIQEQTGANIDVMDDGRVNVVGKNKESAQKAVALVQSLTQEAELGKIYIGSVQRVTDFGAFVEILPGTDGLVHISEITDKKIRRVTDVLREGDEVKVKVVGIDRQGKIRLSRREAIRGTAEEEKP